MSSQERPEGWTDRMQPLNQDAVADPRGPAPEFGGAGGPRMAAPQGAGDGAPTGTPPQNQSPQGGAQEPQMTQGERYWYDQCMEARSQLRDVAPLLPYIDVINYMDANPDSVALVRQHMVDNLNGVGPNNNLPNPNAGDNTGVHQNVNTPARQQNGTYNGVSNQQNSNADFRKALEDANMEFLKKNGIPDHEADMYINFLMNPGDLKPEQLFNMFKVARGQQPTNYNQNTPNNSQQPAPVSQTPAPNAAPSEGFNASVAGMNGGVDPVEVDRRVNEGRNVLDANTI